MMMLALLLPAVAAHSSGTRCGQSLDGAHGMTRAAIANATRRVPVEHGPHRRQDIVNATALRIHLDFSNLHTDGKFCASAGQSVTLLEGGAGRTTTCTAEDVLTDTRRTYLREKVLHGALIRIREQLGIQFPLLGPLRVPAAAVCDGFHSPPEHADPGVSEADTVIYVAAGPISQEQVLAFGGVCGLVSGSGRPAISIINFNPRHLTPPESAVRGGAAALELHREGMVDTAVHELLHALGFLNGFFDHVLSTRTIAGASRTLVTGPETIAAIRAHTGCPTLPGVELQRGDGSHWSPKWLSGEMMTPAGGGRFSAMTAAAMVDLGVGYILNSLGVRETVTWGRGWGCGPFTEPCNTEAGGAGTIFCFNTSRPVGCTFDRRGFGPCGVSTQSSDIPIEAFRYFPGQPAVGGDAGMDYCPVYQAFGNRQCQQPNAASGQVAGVPDSEGNVFGPSSACFAVTAFAAANQSGAQPSDGHRCLAMDTPPNPGTCARGEATPDIAVRVLGSAATPCPVATSITMPSRFTGSVRCPESASVVRTLCGLFDERTLPPSATVGSGERARSARMSAAQLWVLIGAMLAAAFAGLSC